MKNYEILPHTADFKIKAFGKTKEELFLNALLGMESGLRPKLKSPAQGEARQRRQKSKVKNIKIKSLDLQSLLVDFLNEALYLTQTKREVYKSLKFKKFSDSEIEAEIFGEKVESFGEDIKAVTHHNLDIKQNKNGNWETIVLFDI